ncbi:UrcA family protein [Sphingorhabdus buctiana]|jgi:UrcA family protein|uniref:UrcA family protein n=1 Tax=Sphingorhabdus buctiana TaxID=1508805 RepID=A0ABW4MGE6_9SPHN
MAKSMFRSLMAAAAVSATLAAAPVSAADRHQKVQYDDLDLSTEAGQSIFKSRVIRAVRNVCAFPQARTSFERLDQVQCEARAKAAAMSKAEKTIARHGGTVKVALD